MHHFLLLQARNFDDPMRLQEVGCFSRALRCDPEQIELFDLLTGAPDDSRLGRVDVVLLGGSGDYSVAQGGSWLGPALGAMRHLVEIAKPTFASCWGSQAMARALGGEVVTDMDRAELGTIEVAPDRGRSPRSYLRSVGRSVPGADGAPRLHHPAAARGHTACVERQGPESSVSHERKADLLHPVPSRTRSRSVSPASARLSSIRRVDQR